MFTKEETAIIIAPKDNLPQRLSPNSTICASSSDREGNNSIVPEKPSEDGYNWRKYGQKNVKGNEYIRSYYKCSHPNCQVKKQVERSHDGRITDITYLGKHDHVKPNSDPQTAVSTLLSVKVQIADHPPAIAVEDTPSDATASATDNVDELAIVKKTDSTTPPPPTSSLVRDDHGENLTLKKRKKGVDVIDSTAERSNHESRVVVHTVSEVDVVNDGYRWRKYGQKMVKGNPNPRSYYRCSTTGCPVKKHVERASHDSRVVITTYEGEHDHSMPPIRTIVPQIPGSLGGTESDGVTKSKSEESDPEKSDCINPTATSKEVNNSMVMIKTDDHTSQSTDQETRLAKRTDPITQTTQEQKAPPVKSDMGPEIVPMEVKPSAEPDKKLVNVPTEGKPLAERNKKPEIVPTEAKPVAEPDKKPKSVPTDGAKPLEEPNKKPKIVPTEAKPSAETNKKSEIVPTEAKPSAKPEKNPESIPTEANQSEEPDKKPEIIPTEVKPSEEPDKKPEIVPTEAKPSEEPNKKPEIVSTEAKSNGQPKC